MLVCIYCSELLILGCLHFCFGITIYFFFFLVHLKIVHVYVHLARGDTENIFPAAISKDGRSYNEQVVQLLWNFSTNFLCAIRIQSWWENLLFEHNLTLFACSSYLVLQLMYLGGLVKTEELYRNSLSLVREPKWQLLRQWILKLPLERYQMNSLTQFKYVQCIFFVSLFVSLKLSRPTACEWDMIVILPFRKDDGELRMFNTRR